MGAAERWAIAIVKPDGTILLHTENDGPAVLRRGLEAEEEVITLEELKQCYPTQYRDALRQLVELDRRAHSPR